MIDWSSTVQMIQLLYLFEGISSTFNSSSKHLTTTEVGTGQRVQLSANRFTYLIHSLSNIPMAVKRSTDPLVWIDCEVSPWSIKKCQV